MPRGNGTGPLGEGRMTGRGLGFCSGRGVAGYTVGAPGRGLSLGRGRGYRNIFRMTGVPGGLRSWNGEQIVDYEEELALLKARSQSNRREAEVIEQRIEELEKKITENTVKSEEDKQ